LIGAFCSGVFLLAEAGLLDDRRATTTWWLQSELKRRFPKIDLASDAVVTSEDRIVCAAGPMSWVDLLLRLIEMVEGHETARLCADYAVIDTAQRHPGGLHAARLRAARETRCWSRPTCWSVAPTRRR
jgi:transcriptional regulator GlxA family with amidase domain